MAHLDELTLNAYLDDELPASHRAEAEAHLADCPACQAELAALQQLFFALDSAAEAPFTVDVSAAVAQQIAAESANRKQFSVSSGLVLVSELVAAGVLLFLLWPTIQEWLGWIHGWQTQLAWNITWPDPISWAELHEQLSAIIQSIPSLPAIDLATMQWFVLIGVALIIWLAGNRLIFTNDAS
ncbi:MAG: hypothetical protein CSA11_07890 [Chloroflexi bacterium]|nr:MAG: hypothetical protein CSA11_07890 [Chloroflexota bacterium]